MPGITNPLRTGCANGVVNEVIVPTWDAPMDMAVGLRATGRLLEEG